MTAKNDSISWAKVLRGIGVSSRRTGAMNAGVPLLKALLDDSPRALKHKFQSINVPLRSLYVSDRAKYLALYNIHCAHPIGIANVHTPAERRGGKPTLRSRFTGSYIQLHKDNSARQDPAESTEQAGRSVDHHICVSISIGCFPSIDLIDTRVYHLHQPSDTDPHEVGLRTPSGF